MGNAWVVAQLDLNKIQELQHSLSHEFIGSYLARSMDDSISSKENGSASSLTGSPASLNSDISNLTSSVDDFSSRNDIESIPPITRYPPHKDDRRLLKKVLSHSAIQIDQTQLLEELKGPDRIVVLNGSNLDIPSLVAIARFGSRARIDDDPLVAKRIQASVDFLKQELDSGHSIYGITTGFGGSANTNTNQFESLQVALLQMQLCGILPEHSNMLRQKAETGNSSLHYEVGLATMSMPESWVRAAMVVRINALIKGDSAVRLQVLQSLEKLLQNDIVPFVPLHGSISASGDLSPLSYIAGALEGNPDVYVWTGSSTNRTLVASNEVLEATGIEPIRFGPKEGLGILNGTAFSVGVAALAMYEANNLAVMAQILTAMGVEALTGSTESFEPFIAAVRPHPGQSEAASNIARALRGSKLVQEARDEDTRSLRQDRYPLRTASQWLGPSLEDLRLATEQLETELNSTTDNPLIDAESKRIFHGGNFQAASVTSSTEKTRLALQMIGKLIFAQSSELLDTKMNNGLPPNLALDEPSLSYTLKGVDINMAAYMAELGFLANPVSSHIQSAEMGNQSLNSMALVSARYTHKAIDIVTMMMSAYLYSLCQAVDLRALHEIYLAALRPKFDEITANYLKQAATCTEAKQWQNIIWSAFKENLALTVTEDSATRFMDTARALQPILLDILASSAQPPGGGLCSNTSAVTMIQDCTDRLATSARDIFVQSRVSYAKQPDASAFLGAAANSMYTFVRKELSIPLHKGIVDYPVAPGRDSKLNVKQLNTGSWVSKIYTAMRDGKVAKVLRNCI